MPRDTAYYQTQVTKWIHETQLTRRERDESRLTLVTLCDMVLGEDAPDRSDDALIRAVGRLLRTAGPQNSEEGAP